MATRLGPARHLPFHSLRCTKNRIPDNLKGPRWIQVTTPLHIIQSRLLSLACCKCSSIHKHTAMGVWQMLQRVKLCGPTCCTVYRRMASGARKSSSLFVSGGSENMAPAPVQVDLDLGTRLSGENVLQLRQNLSARQMNFDLDQLLEDYKTFRDVDQAKVSLEKERVEIADQMSTLIKDKSKTSEEVSEEKASLTKRGKHVREQFKVISQARWEAEEKVMLRALNLPADLHTDTPEDGDRVLDSTEGTVTSPDPPVNHLKFAEQLGLLKFSNVGPRSVYLLGELAELEMCLIQRVTAVMHDHDLLQIASPEIFRSVVAEGCGFDPANCEQIFTLQEKDDNGCSETNAYHLKGTSLLAYSAFLARVQLRGEHLPSRMFSIGRHYQPRSKSDLPGLYGAIQSNRVTVFAACSNADEATDVCRGFTRLAWDVTRELGLPSRLVTVSPPSLLPSESLRTEVQVWAPSLQRYLQVGRVSQHGDYVSRRLMCRQHPGGDFVHMVSGVAIDVTTILVALLEHSYPQGKPVFPSSVSAWTTKISSQPSS